MSIISYLCTIWLDPCCCWQINSNKAMSSPKKQSHVWLLSYTLNPMVSFLFWIIKFCSKSFPRFFWNTSFFLHGDWICFVHCIKEYHLSVIKIQFRSSNKVLSRNNSNSFFQKWRSLYTILVLASYSYKNFL